MAEYEKAINDFNSAIKLDKNNPTFYKIRGTTYHYMGEYDKAINDFN